MFIIVIFLCIVQFRLIYNIENGCGCSLSRTQISVSEKYIFNKLQTEDSNQCSLKYENDKLDRTDEMILVPAGEYQIGTDEVIIESDREGPKRTIHINDFYLDKYEVSNRDFSRFVAFTNYKTEAEIFGDSFVFSLFLNDTFKDQMKDFRVVQAMWWYKIKGADWRHPHGPDSDLSDLLEHPVIHVSWKDAHAYCKWRDARLPTEAEWEAACRGGRRNTMYPWGNKLYPNKTHRANIWQGTFPTHNSEKDGYIGTNPVQLFPQNDFGFHNMAGNVWEWTQDSWSPDNRKEKVKKGGSYLCHRSYCYRYRCSARSHNTEDSSAGNLGFRCAKSPNV